MAKQPQSIQVDASQNETAKYVVYGVVAVGVLALAYFGIIKPINAGSTGPDLTLIGSRISEICEVPEII